MLHPPALEEEKTGDNGRAVRYTINIETGAVRTDTFPNTINNRHIDKFGRDLIIISYMYFLT